MVETVRATKELAGILECRRRATALFALLVLGLVAFGCVQTPTPVSINPTATPLAGVLRPTGMVKPSPTPVVKSLQTFHDVHTKTVNLECTACHKTQEAPSYVRAEAGVLEVSPTNALREVDRKACLGCHQAGPKPWYGDQMLKAGEAYAK